MNYYFLYTNSSNKLWKKFVTFSEDILLDSNGTSSLNDIVDNVNNHIFIKALIKGKGILSNSETDFVNTYFPPYARINEICMIREDIYNSFPNININGGEVYDVDIIGDFTVKYKALIFNNIIDCINWDCSKNDNYPIYKDLVLNSSLIPQEIDGFFLKNWSPYGRCYSIVNDILKEYLLSLPESHHFILFEKLNMPHAKKTKTGYSTAADVLEKLAEEYPIVSKILEYRQLAKLKSTYADGLAVFIGDDGRIHGKFNQTVTATGRLSSTEPNLQNIPVRMELGRMIRKVFVPKEDCVFVDADYSQIELRVLAHCSGDEQLIKAYREATDIHRMTASQVFHTPFDEVTDLQRRNAKAVNFGIVYGISSFGLSMDLSITRKEAAEYIEHYFETYPGVKKFLDDSVENAKEKGYAVTLFGRRRPVPELKSSNFMQRNFGERVAMNAPIQGTAADIMKIAMIDVHKELKKRNMKSRMILQVHDELLIEAECSEVDEVKEILRDKMENAVKLSVPLIVDMHTGKNWYEAK